MPGRAPKPLAQYGPFYGMRYAFDPTDNGANAGYVYDALNMLPADPLHGGAYLRRPADQRATVAASTLVAQWMGVFRLRSGFLTVGIFAGEIYTLSGTTWLRQVTTANLTTAGATLSATRAIGCITFTNLLVINDSVNQPITWNGTSGAGGIAVLTNAPTTCFGQPFVYYGKLGFIKDVAGGSLDRSTFVWSEENAPNTGYEAAGYTNAWTLEQSGSGPLYAMLGTNEELFFWRAHGIGSIRGSMNATFSSDGVTDGISTYYGTDQPFGPVYAAGRPYFTNTLTGELCVIEAGQVRRIGSDMQDLIGNGLYLSLGLASIVVRLVSVPVLNAVAVSYSFSAGRSQNLGSGTAITFLVSTMTHRCLGRLTCQYGPSNSGGGTLANGGSLPAIGEAYDSSYNIYQFMAAGYNAGSTYTFRTPPSPSDTLYNNTTPPSVFSVTLGPYQSPPGTTAQVSQLEAFYDLLPTDGGSVTATTATLAVNQSSTELVGATTADQGSVTLTPDQTYRQEIRQVVGVNEEWRTFQPSVRDSGTLRNYPWGLKRLLVYGETVPIEPESA